MASDDPDELELLRDELASIGVTRSPDPEDFGLSFRSAEAFFAASVESEQTLARVESVGSRRQRRVSLRPVMTGAAVAVIAAILALVVVLPGGDGPGGPPGSEVPDRPGGPAQPSAPAIVPISQVLRRAASASAGQPDQSDAKYWRVESIQQQGRRPSERRVVWQGHDGPGLLIDKFGRYKLPKAEFGLQKTSLSWDDLVALPAKPAALRRLLESEAEGLPNQPWRIFKMAGELLAESPAPPELRRALWLVIADIPGVRTAGLKRDALGREGVQFSYADPERGVQRYIVDPDDGAILQGVVVLTHRNAVRYQVTYLSRGPASRHP